MGKKVKSSTNWGGDWEHDQDKIKNAYILVYERKKYMEATHEEEEKEEEEEKKKSENAPALTPQPTADDSKEEQDNKEQEADTPKPAKLDVSSSALSQSKDANAEEKD